MYIYTYINLIKLKKKNNNKINCDSGFKIKKYLCLEKIIKKF